MTSPEKTASNRKNASKSTGPKTVDGKARSARNAVTHGLTAQPGDPTEAYQENLAEWIGDLKSNGIAERTLAERACRAAWSLKRCDRYEDATAAKRDRDAAEMYDLAEAVRAREIGRRLLSVPVEVEGQAGSSAAPMEHNHAAEVDPASLVAVLRTTAAGVAWLLAQWAELGRALKDAGGWDKDRKFVAARLLGLTPDSARDHPLGRRIYPSPVSLGSIVPRGSLLDEPGLVDAVEAASRRGLGEPPTLFLNYVAALEKPALDPAKSKPNTAKLKAMVRCERAKLARLNMRVLRSRADDDRAGAADRSLFDDSRSLSLCLRYATAASRDLHRAITDLAKLRKAAGDESQNEEPDPTSPPRTPVDGAPDPKSDASTPPRDAPKLRNEAKLAPPALPTERLLQRTVLEVRTDLPGTQIVPAALTGCSQAVTGGVARGRSRVPLTTKPVVGEWASSPSLPHLRTRVRSNFAWTDPGEDRIKEWLH